MRNFSFQPVLEVVFACARIDCQSDATTRAPRTVGLVDLLGSIQDSKGGCTRSPGVIAHEVDTR